MVVRYSIVLRPSEICTTIIDGSIHGFFRSNPEALWTVTERIVLTDKGTTIASYFIQLRFRIKIKKIYKIKTNGLFSLYLFRKQKTASIIEKIVYCFRRFNYAHRFFCLNFIPQFHVAPSRVVTIMCVVCTCDKKKMKVFLARFSRRAEKMKKTMSSVHTGRILRWRRHPVWFSSKIQTIINIL